MKKIMKKCFFSWPTHSADGHQLIRSWGELVRMRSASCATCGQVKVPWSQTGDPTNLAFSTTFKCDQHVFVFYFAIIFTIRPIFSLLYFIMLREITKLQHFNAIGSSSGKWWDPFDEGMIYIYIYIYIGHMISWPTMWPMSAVLTQTKWPDCRWSDGYQVAIQY